MRLIDRIHRQSVSSRRARVLAGHLVGALKGVTSVLDVGSGDGQIAAMVKAASSGLTVEGVDVLVRPDAAIPVRLFDGRSLPFDDASFDAAMLIDVLHHTADPELLLREVARVARGRIVIKDHVAQGVFAVPTLRFMDRVGNARYGVALPYNYQTEAQWRSIFTRCRLTVTAWKSDLNLYPLFVRPIFERRLHVLVTVVPT